MVIAMIAKKFDSLEMM